MMAIAGFAHREVLRHLHPDLVRPARVGSGILPDDVARLLVGFMILAPGRAVAMVQMFLGRLEIYLLLLALSVVSPRIPRALRRDLPGRDLPGRAYQDGANLLIVLARE